MTVLVRTAFVNVYELHLHYGGPEEGGWWWTSGTPVKSLAVPEIEALDFAATLSEVYPMGTGSAKDGAYWSVIYEGGDYRVYIEDEPAAVWPDERPHYE